MITVFDSANSTSPGWLAWWLFPDVESALRSLSGGAMGVITNGDKPHQQYNLEKLGILKYFSDIITPACARALVTTPSGSIVTAAGRHA